MSMIGQITMAPPLQQQHHLRLLFLCLLLLFAMISFFFPGAGAQSDDYEPPADCFYTSKGVPKWCSEEFARALHTDNKYPVNAYCCMMLRCVREASCKAAVQSTCKGPDPDPTVPFVCPPPA